jgi:hypothetical protein
MAIPAVAVVAAAAVAVAIAAMARAISSLSPVRRLQLPLTSRLALRLAN